MNKITYLLFIFLCNLWIHTSYAEECSELSSFEKISLSCIQSNQAKIEAVSKKYETQQKKIEALKKNKGKGSDIRKAEYGLRGVVDLQNLENAKKAINTTYFYKTASGALGKFIVRSANVNVKECNIFLDARTYTSDGVKDVSSNLTIINEANSWNIDNASMDLSGRSDFTLKREHGRCVLKSNLALAYKFGQTDESDAIEGNVILMYAGYFLAGLAIFLIMFTVFSDEDRFKAESRLEDADEDGKKQAPTDFVLKYSQPFFKRYFSPIVKGMKYKKKIRDKYKRTLASSGMNKFLTPEDFYAFKLFLIIGFPVVYIFGGKFLELEVDLALTPVVMFVGYFYPDFWIKDKIARRKEEILLSMPFIVDMLALSVEAGLDFTAAIQRVIQKAPPSALVDEFDIFLREIKVGSSRAEALRQLSWRADSLPISSFCATLIAADSVGTSNLSPILKSLSSEIRQKRSTDIEKKGAQAATKILFPMMLFILPAVVVIIAAPFVIGFAG